MFLYLMVAVATLVEPGIVLPVVPEAVTIVAPALPAIVASRGTPVRLMVLNEVSTKTAQAGDLFTLLVDAPVKIGDQMVIARGTRAVGKVVDAAESGIVGKSGKLVTRLLYLDVDGVRVSLDGDPRSAGRNGNVQVVLATLALTPWGLFARGNNAKLKAGDIVVGSLAED